VAPIPLAGELLEQAESELAGWTDPVARLRQAIEKNEFDLYCQPILTLSGEGAGGYALADPDFPRFVAAQLTSNKVSPAALLFEIDESDTLHHLEDAVQFAMACHALGAKLMIDAFGRRSVSFAAVKELGVAYVKVDGSIVRRLLSSPACETKLKAIVRVGEALGYQTIAEMVEDQDILMRLKALGVGYAQGFGIQQPHPIEKIAR